MLTSLPTRLKKAGRWLPLALLPFAAQAQFNYAPANALNVAGTYTDLGTAGTVIATANNDDANSTAQAIGFTFTYNGTAFTQFVLSTNGLIKLGSTAPSAANLFICNTAGCTNVDPVESTSPADVNLILPFNFDLEPGTSAPEYRVATSGTAPNRVCTIQWKNVSDKADATPSNKQYTNFSFQAKLYETTNNVEFVYGTATASAATPESRFPNVGIKGSSSASGQDLLASKTTGAGAWTTTTFITGSYPGSTHNIRNAALPDPGRTYRFVTGTGGGTTAPANDECATATLLTTSSTCVVTTATNAGATASAGAPAPGANCFLATTPISNDVWFRVVVPTSGALTVTTSAATGSPVNDTGVLVYSGTCGTLTEVGCSDDVSSSNFFSNAAVTGLTSGSTVYIRVWSFGTTPTGQFGICVTAPAPGPANDAAVAAIYTLGKVSSIYGSPVTAQAVITNTGTSVQTNLAVTLTVSGATTYTNTQTVATLAAGASTTVNFSYPVTGGSGTNTVTVTIPADAVTTNNTLTYSQLVTAASLAYIDASQPLNTTGVGVGGGGGGALAVKYTLAQAATVSSITPTFVGAGTAGTTYQVLLYDAAGTGGTPGALLYTSATQTRPTATASPAITVPNIAVATGAFFVAIKELNNNVGIAYQVEDPLRPATFYYQTAGGAWTLVNTTTLRTRLALEVGFAIVTAPVTNLTVGSITNNSGSVTFTAAAGATSYTVTYSTGGGTPVTVTTTASPFTLTGLTANTTYTVTVVANYSGGGTSTATSTNFTTLLGTATHTALGNGTMDVFPNPAQRTFMLTLPAVAGARAAEVALFNSLGQQVQTRTIELNATGTQVPMTVTGLATGIYTLHVKAGSQVATIKLVINN